MTRDVLETFYERHYVPDNMITIVVGDINANAVEQRLREQVSYCYLLPRAPVVGPEEPTQIAPRHTAGCLCSSFRNLAVIATDSSSRNPGR